MFTIRNLGGVSLFLFGTAFAWITPEFVTAGLDNTGALWFTVRILALLTAAGFTAATWGLFKATAWWETSRSLRRSWERSPSFPTGSRRTELVKRTRGSPR